MQTYHQKWKGVYETRTSWTVSVRHISSHLADGIPKLLYRLVDLVLVPEHLVQFRISPKSVLHSSTRKKINLTDAYVYSGYLAAQMLPAGQLNSDANNVPRRYYDGRKNLVN